ncbi:uncharacterized protein LOC6731424 [Drosophila simulans]|uniref:N-acetyltransferase domain-containing protein n=2 Tax=Drosophila simulans TaxID=7240 RepID=A0A0J9QY45_DROSI|nr:uncharacterized protein LOC6731424 [Drosophila simulans]KMY88896.1 uncharacterized protein Dsimw501_GD22447 [Drosophila simulans]
MEMQPKLIEKSRWPELRDLYANDRTNLTGFDLIEYFLNYIPLSTTESIKIYTTDKDWTTHGSYILIHYLENKAYIYLNTIKGFLEDLGNLLLSLNLKVFHLICGYEERFKPLVEAYWLNLGQNLLNLEHQGAIVYHLPSYEIPSWKPSVSTSCKVAYLTSNHADLVDKHWAYRSADSMTLIRGFMENNLAAGVFDIQGQPLAWCLRSPHGSLSNLHVLSSHRRMGLGSLAVRFMAHEIKLKGSEVLATVVPENEGSQKMFEKLGFKPINKLYWAVIPCTL